MTDEEVYAAYLMQFGTASISQMFYQPGEELFLVRMAQLLRTTRPDFTGSVWFIVLTEHIRRKER